MTAASKIMQQAPLRVFGNRKGLFRSMPYSFPEENVLQSSSQSRPSFSAARNKWYWKAQLQTQSHFTSLKLQTDLVCHELQPQHLYSTLQDLKVSLCCEQVSVPALWLGKLHTRSGPALILRKTGTKSFRGRVRDMAQLVQNKVQMVLRVQRCQHQPREEC